MGLTQLLGSLELGLIYGLVALGVYFTLRILQFPDLTVDGSFPLGAAVAAVAITHGVDPYQATLLAILAGAASGVVTGYLATRLRILNLLAGILSLTALSSINLRVMGGPNLPLFDSPTLMTPLLNGGFSYDQSKFIILVPVVVVLCTLSYLFLLSPIGLNMRAVGGNSRMAQAQGVSPTGMTKLGLSLSNGIIALAGALYAQLQEFADTSIGAGTLITGLAAVILGEVIIPSSSIFWAIVRCIVGAVVHRLITALALNLDILGMQPSDLNLVTALLVALALLLPRLRSYFKTRRSSHVTEMVADDDND
jgi:putative ABC transport system permease protein